MCAETATEKRRWWQREPVEERTLTRETVPVQMLGTTPAGAAVSTRGAMALADVYSCVRLLSDTASTLPLLVYRRTGASRQRVRNNTAALLERPAPGVTTSQLVSQMVAHFALWGEIFLGVYRSGGEIVQLGCLAPDRVFVTLENGSPFYRYTAPLGQIFDRLTTKDVVHVRGMSLDGLRGASPVALCREAMGLSAALSEEASAFAANASTPHGLLTVADRPGATETAETLISAWRDRLRGSSKAGTIGVLIGDVQFQALSMSRRDAEYVASRELSTREVARIFRVPASLIGASSGDSLTYATSESERLAFVTMTLAPILTAIEQALSSVPELFPPDFFAEFLIDGFLRASSGERAATYATLVGAGVMTANEARQRENLPPLPGGDVLRPNTGRLTAATDQTISQETVHA